MRVEANHDVVVKYLRCAKSRHMVDSTVRHYLAMRCCSDKVPCQSGDMLPHGVELKLMVVCTQKHIEKE